MRNNTQGFIQARLVGLLRLRALLVAGSALLILYLAVLHPWMMAWGASAAEQRMALPGDDAAAGPADSFTRAITIDAPAAQIWPWLLQIGQDRAGFYSNDWLENLIGDDVHNANTIRPEWQQRQIGDVVPLVPRNYLGGLAGRLAVGQAGAQFGPHIWLLEPGRVIADTPGRFVLLPIDAHTTRLLIRESLAANTPGGGAIGVVAGRLAWDPVHFVMVQRMLRGVKERAEGRPLTPPALDLMAGIGWLGAGLGLLGFFLERRAYGRLLLALAAASPALLFSGDANAALAAFLAVGITVAGALAWGRRWWPGYALIAAGVLLVLLLAPDAYTAFGLAFDLIGMALVARRIQRGRAALPGPLGRGLRS